MNIINLLNKIWDQVDYPFIIHPTKSVKFSQLTTDFDFDLSIVKPGDVVALIGDFNPISISLFLKLIDLKTIIVPLTEDTKNEHEYFFESANVDVIIQSNSCLRRNHSKNNDLIEQLRIAHHAGLVLFSTGTIGRPKAILHNLSIFLKKFQTPRPTLRTLSFLLFDHIGGINTLLHTLFNKGVVIVPEARSVEKILNDCYRYDVELLPTTPTFLRMMLMSGMIPSKVPKCLKIITYGTERMDQPTLDALCELLPDIEFRQTFGMSELGIVRVKSEARNSLYMKVGGEGVEIKIIDDILHIRSQSRMLGYLNAESPFDSDGWYDTKDIVECKGEFIKVVGRITEVINVGGLKFMSSEVERVALEYPNVSFVKAFGKTNPITGQHLELIVEFKDSHSDKDGLLNFLKQKLQSHMVPRRIIIENIKIGHRFKKN